MVEPESDEQSCGEVKHQAPGVSHVACQHCHIARQRHQHALSEDGGDAVERGAYAHEPRLLVMIEAEHVEAVGCNVVGGA